MSADAGRPAGTLVLVGCGHMGSAMLRGWLAAGAAARFVVIEPAGLPAGIDDDAVLCHPGPEHIPEHTLPDAVVFAVKPQVIDEVLPAYARWVRPQTVFLSIAAGKTLAGLSRHLGGAALVRAMPNTPAAIGRGITVACANERVAPAQRALCERLLAAIGESAWVEDETLIDPVTAVSGSGPAYVFLLIEALAMAGERQGLPADLALRLARATVAGSGELARLAGDSPARLRENVTSPGGTTRAALDVLMAADGLPALMERAVAAATARSRELAS
ncbi:MAG: pyrroline-5-carboxylate reductase [Alphaproteobacteria bacterium]|nr:pyrroline-5-carboxylate reductase [Alphaproteobacteria bacterium]